MARGSGGSISDATSGPARTTRSSSSTTSTATGARKSRARPPTGRSTARGRSSATRRRTIARWSTPTDGLRVASAADARFGKILAGPEYFTIFDGLHRRRAGDDRLHSRPRAAGRLGRDRRQRRQRQQRQPRRSIPRRRRVSRRPPAERADGARLLRPIGDRRVGLARRHAHVAMGLRFGQRAAAVSEPGRLSLLRAGQSQPRRSPTSTPTAGTRSSTDRWSWTTTARDCSRPVFATATRCTSATSIRRGPGLEVFGIHENEDATVALGTPGAGALRRAHRRDHLEPAAGRRRRPRAGGRHRSTASRRGVLDAGAAGSARRARPADLATRRARRTSPSGGTPIRSARFSTRNWIAKWDPCGRVARAAADRRRRRRQQRLEGDARALGRSPRRLARRSDLALRGQHVAADLHDHDSRDRSPASR